jgi:hypothetical protein
MIVPGRLPGQNPAFIFNCRAFIQPQSKSRKTLGFVVRQFQAVVALQRRFGYFSQNSNHDNVS